MSFGFQIDQALLLLHPLLVGDGPSYSSSPTLRPLSATPKSGDLIKVTLYPEWYKDMSLAWTIPTSWGNCKFNIHVSDGGANYIKLNSTPLSSPFFKDVTSKDYSRFEGPRYIVEVLLPGGSTVFSQPAVNEYKLRERLEKIANEVQRREYLLLTKFTGVKSFLFKKRNFGDRCPRCWDARIEKVMDDHCEVCFGTSWNEGFFEPTPLFIQYEANPTSKLKTYQGVMESNSPAAWTISVPNIEPDDVVIRLGDYSAFKIISVNTTVMQTKQIRQLLSLTQLSRTDVENKLLNRLQIPESSNYVTEITGPFNESRFPKNLVDTDLSNDPAWSKPMDLFNLPKYSV